LETLRSRALERHNKTINAEKEVTTDPSTSFDAARKADKESATDDINANEIGVDRFIFYPDFRSSQITKKSVCYYCIVLSL
jgi:hypothetical protein